MDKLKPFLIEWTKTYLMHKDILTKKITAITENKDNFDLIVKYADKEQFVIIEPVIGGIEQIISRLNEEQHFTLVVFNTKENFDIVSENFNRLAAFKNFNIIFVNPLSELDKKWIISPYTHNRICDPASLKTGLKALFDGVAPITKEELNEKI